LDLKETIARDLRDWGNEILDIGAHTYNADDDYPDYSAALARSVVAQDVERGILICGSGVGASIAANKIRGARAALCHDTYSAHQGVEHDHMNILVLGARIIGVELARELVKSFLQARFSGEERHTRRLHKVLAIEDAGR